MKLKNSIFTILFLFSTLIGFTQKISYTIKGKINIDSKADFIYLQGNSINVEIPISADRNFFYKGTSTEPEWCFIKTDKSYAWSLWITNGEIDITLQEWELEKPDTSGKKLLKITTLSGPAETEKYKWFTDVRNNMGKGFRQLPFTQFKDSMIKYFDPMLEEYILEHPHSKFSVCLSELAFSKQNQIKLLQFVDSKISTDRKMRIENSIKRDSVTKAGLLVQDFEMKNINTKVFSSINLASKYTLLEFWSNDCYPCRAQHPALIKIYNDFHLKGFEIVSVFLGNSKIEWQKAVNMDKMTWIQISDLKGWDNFLAKRFFINVIPFNILIDDKKRIIATGLQHEALQLKLMELLGQ